MANDSKLSFRETLESSFSGNTEAQPRLNAEPADTDLGNLDMVQVMLDFEVDRRNYALVQQIENFQKRHEDLTFQVLRTPL